MKDKEKTEPFNIQEKEINPSQNESSFGQKLNQFIKSIKEKPLKFWLLIGAFFLLILIIIIIIASLSSKDLTKEEKASLIISSLPEKSSMTYEDFISILQKKSEELDLNEEDKAWLVYEWITHNIVYKHGGKVNAKFIFENGYAVCTGYALLFHDILQHLGFPKENTIMVNGYVQFIGYCTPESIAESNHDWSAVKINGKWCLCDLRLGTGNNADENFFWYYNDHFYCTPPEKFIKTHIPTDKKYQFLDKPYTSEQYCNDVPVGLNFFTEGFKKIEPDSAYIYSKQGKIKYYFYDNPEITMYSNIKKNGEELKGLITITKYKDYFELSYNLTQTGNYTLTLMSKKSKSSKWKTFAEQTFIIKN